MKIKTKIKIWLITLAIITLLLGAIFEAQAVEKVGINSVKNDINKKLDIIKDKLSSTNNKDQVILINNILYGALNNFDSFEELNHVNEKTNEYITISKFAYLEKINGFNKSIALIKEESLNNNKDDSRLKVIYDMDYILYISIALNIFLLLLVIARRDPFIVTTGLMVFKIGYALVLFCYKITEMLIIAVINLVAGIIFASKYVLQKK